MQKNILQVLCFSLFLFTIFVTHSEDLWQVPMAEAFTPDYCWDCSSGTCVFYPAGNPTMCDFVPPTVDINATPTTVNYNTRTTIDWAVDDLDISRCTTSGPWPGMGGVYTGTVQSNLLTSNSTFSIVCRNSAGQILKQDSVSVTVNPAPTPPPSPSNFNGSCVLQGNGTYNIPLTWSLVTGATNYPIRLSGPSHANNAGIQIISGTDVVGMGVAGDAAPTGGSYTWTGLTSGTYSTWVHAWNGNGWSDPPSSRTIICSPPASPVNGSCGSAATTYAASATTYSGTFCSAGTASPASPAFPAQGGSTTWQCMGSGGGSTASCTATRNAPATTYTVSYSGNSNTGGTAPSSQTKTQGVNLTLRTNTGTLTRTGYVYSGWNTLAAGNGTNYAAGSTYSTDAGVTLYAKWILAQPSAPTVSTGASCGGQITASWASVTGATGYDLQYKLTSGSTWTLLSNVTSPRTITGLTEGTSYDIQLRVKNAAGNSAWSAYSTTASSAACVASAPDLVSQGLSVTGTREEGSTLTLGATVRNQGTVAAGAFSDDFTYQWNGTGGTWLSISTIAKSSGLAAGDTSTDGASFPLTRTGTLYIQHCVDTFNQINEGTNETPNCSVSGGLVINNSTTAGCSGGQTVANCVLSGAASHGTSQDGSCANGYGGTCSYTCSNGTWTTPSTNTCTGPLITEFRVCTSPGDCTNAPGTHTVATGTPLTLSWTANADTCNAIAGTGFSTGVGFPPSGSDAITATTVADSIETYTIGCRYGSGVIVQRSLNVQTMGVGPELIAPRTVQQGSTARIEWDTNNGNETSCTLTGGIINGVAALGNGTGTNETGYIDVVIQGRTTFTLICDGQSAVKTVEIIPASWES